MNNVKNFEYSRLDLYLNNSEYWDYYITFGDNLNSQFGCIISGDCLISQFEFFNPETIDSGNTRTIYSTKTWANAINSGVTATTYGLTGLDNGAIEYNRDPMDTSNIGLVDKLTGSTLTLESGDTRFFMTAVSGYTGNIVYPMDYIMTNDSIGNHMNMIGGFYQGFYKLDGYNYQTLPNRVNKGFLFDLWVNKNDGLMSGVTGTTLNDLYPNNKGIFLYLGTRAENKFWNIFEGLNTGSTSGCTIGATELCTVPKETDVSIINDKGYIIPLDPPRIEYTEINNGFLIYGNAGKYGCSTGDTIPRLSSLTYCDVSGETPTLTISSTTQVKVDFTNPFLIYGNACGGCSSGCTSCNTRPSDGYGRENIYTYSGDTVDMTELDKDADIVDNALAFIIKDDGSIGYRRLTITASCVDEKTITGVTVTEKFSQSGMVDTNKWEHISIRWGTDFYDDCQLENENGRLGRLMFYVNCKLKFVVDDFPEFIASRLDEYKEKQIGVPYNISLGGGSQGLLESMTFDGQDPDDLGLAIERNFAGSFIGGISQFKIYNCDINWCALRGTCNDERYL